MGELAFSHPGKLGDCIYVLPTIKRVCELEHKQADFYTSDLCKPLKRLFEYQSYIDQFYISPNYKIERTDMGVQPAYVPTDGHMYDKVYQLGFRKVPTTNIPQFIADQAGIRDIGRVQYEYPNFETLNEPYIVLASRGETTYKNLFLDIIRKCPIKVVLIGGYWEYLGEGINMCGLDMLETVTWIAKSKGFVGLMSSQLTLANGFDVPKVAPHDNCHWDMQHVIYSPTNFYPILPTTEEVLRLLKL